MAGLSNIFGTHPTATDSIEASRVVLAFPLAFTLTSPSFFRLALFLRICACGFSCQALHVACVLALLATEVFKAKQLLQSS